MTIDEAIDVVIARSGHAAYRALCAEDNPNRAQRDAYRKIVLRRARGLARVVVPPQPNHAPGVGSRRLVVAAYTEDVSWVRAVPFPVTVYHHRDCLLVPGDIPCVPLPNVGREAHVYLTHIVGHYDDLDDYTVFSQGNPFEHSPDFLARIAVHSRLTSLTTYYLPDRPAAAVKAFDRIEEVDGFVVRYSEPVPFGPASQPVGLRGALALSVLRPGRLPAPGPARDGAGRAVGRPRPDLCASAPGGLCLQQGLRMRPGRRPSR
jgi:hypothetical protein